MLSGALRPDRRSSRHGFPGAGLRLLDLPDPVKPTSRGRDIGDVGKEVIGACVQLVVRGVDSLQESTCKVAPPKPDGCNAWPLDGELRQQSSEARLVLHRSLAVERETVPIYLETTSSPSTSTYTAMKCPPQRRPIPAVGRMSRPI